jgi:hypothetical protein
MQDIDVVLLDQDLSTGLFTEYRLAFTNLEQTVKQLTPNIVPIVLKQFGVEQAVATSCEVVFRFHVVLFQLLATLSTSSLNRS